MIIIDTDVLSDIFLNEPVVLARLATIARNDRGVAVVTAEEVLRGRLSAIRQASTGRAKIPINRAYDYFQEALLAFVDFEILAYSAQSEIQFLTWRKQKIRVGTNDLRIAAVAVTSNATLVTQNVRDYGQVPGLVLEVW